jgi:hypothetical protein
MCLAVVLVIIIVFDTTSLLPAVAPVDHGILPPLDGNTRWRNITEEEYLRRRAAAPPTLVAAVAAAAAAAAAAVAAAAAAAAAVAAAIPNGE